MPLSLKTVPVAVLLVIIAVAGCIVYANSLGGALVWDDQLLITSNKHITSFSYLPKIVREDLFHMSDTPTGYYRPLQTISYLIDYILWAKDPFGYHLTNIFLQIVTACLVFYLCLLVTARRWQSFCVALIFCIHPAFVPIVGYISGRADILGLCLGLITVTACIRYDQQRNNALLAAGIIAYALACSAKEYYLLTPLFVLAYLVIVRPRRALDNRMRLFLIGLAIVAGTYVLLRATTLNFHQKMGVIAEQSFWVRLAIFPYLITKYIGTIIAPLDLSMEKKLVYATLAEPRFIFSYLVPAAIGVWWYRLWKTKQRIKLFWLSWFILGIVPVANLLMPLKAIWADHWTYVAAIGFIALVVGYAGDMLSRLHDERLKYFFGAVTLVLVFVFLGTITIRENRYWMNEEALYKRILQKSPHSARTIYNMGKLYEEKGDQKRALELYNQAIAESFGKNGQYFNSRGIIYKHMGDVIKARADFEKAIALEPAVAVYHNNLGCSYAETGMIEKARQEWKEALRIDPDDELAQQNLTISGGR